MTQVLSQLVFDFPLPCSSYMGRGKKRNREEDDEELTRFASILLQFSEGDDETEPSKVKIPPIVVPPSPSAPSTFTKQTVQKQMSVTSILSPSSNFGNQSVVPPQSSFEFIHKRASNQPERPLSLPISSKSSLSLVSASGIKSIHEISISSSSSSPSSSSSSSPPSSPSSIHSTSSAHSSSDDSGHKKKRKRTSPDQLDILESYFQRDAMPSQQTRMEIANKLGMTTRRVQIWFQNKRAKLKRGHLSSSSPDSEHFSNTTTKTNHSLNSPSKFA